MKILVTGGIGFIGSHLIIQLVRRGHRVVIVDNLSKSGVNIVDSICEVTGQPDAIRSHNLSLLCYKSLTAFFYEMQHVDLCIHLACNANFKKPSDYYNHNVIGSINLLRCLEKYGYDRLVFVHHKQPHATAPESYDISVDTVRAILEDTDRTRNAAIAVAVPHGPHVSRLLDPTPATRDSVPIADVVETICTYALP